jgi:hypothetical protein
MIIILSPRLTTRSSKLIHPIHLPIIHLIETDKWGRERTAATPFLLLLLLLLQRMIKMHNDEKVQNTQTPLVGEGRKSARRETSSTRLCVIF